MTCSPGDGLAGALANMASRCAPDPGAREWILADRIDSTRIALGNQVTVKLQSIPNRDSLGRFAHVRGIYFSAKGAFVLADGTTGQLTAYGARAVYQNLHLEDVTGHLYFDGLDGRDALDDATVRHYANQQWPYNQSGLEGGQLNPTISTDYGIASNAGAGTVVIDASLYIPLASNADGASPLEGLIPLAAIQAAGDSALRFNVGAAAFPQAPTDVTFGGFRNPDPALQANGGMKVWLDVVYLDHVVVDAPWQIESYTQTEQNGKLRHEERITEYAWIRYHNDETVTGAAQNGLRAVESLAGFTLTVAGLGKTSAYTLDEMVTRMMMFWRTIPDSSVSEDCAERDFPSSLLTRGNGVNTYTLFALMLIPLRQRETAAAGAINYQISTDPNAFIRFLHRTVLCSTADRVAKISQATKCNPCGVMSANGKPVTGGYAPVIVVDQA